MNKGENMTIEMQKRIYRIYQQVMFGEKYAWIAQEYKESLEELQITAQSFTKAQWDAFDRYQDALTMLHDIMMQLALEDFHPEDARPRLMLIDFAGK